MNMQDRICEVIAEQTPFTLQEILHAYRIHQSFDLILEACALAQDEGSASLDMALSSLECQRRNASRYAGIIAWLAGRT